MAMPSMPGSPLPLLVTDLVSTVVVAPVSGSIRYTVPGRLVTHKKSSGPHKISQGSWMPEATLVAVRVVFPTWNVSWARATSAQKRRPTKAAQQEMKRTMVAGFGFFKVREFLKIR